MSISKHINELLYNHNCVIVPGFGAFLTKNIAASRNNDVFSPPKKTIAFNRMLKENLVEEFKKPGEHAQRKFFRLKDVL